MQQSVPANLASMMQSHKARIIDASRMTNAIPDHSHCPQSTYHSSRHSALGDNWLPPDVTVKDGGHINNLPTIDGVCTASSQLYIWSVLQRMGSSCIGNPILEAETAYLCNMTPSS